MQQRRTLLNAKVRTHVQYVLPLVISQPQYVQDKFHKMLMKINRWIYNDCTFKMKNTSICAKIKMPTPQQEILKTSFKFFQNLILKRECRDLTDLIRFPRRTTSRLSFKCPKKQYLRTALEHMTEMYNQQVSDLKQLSKPRLKRRLMKVNLKYQRD